MYTYLIGWSKLDIWYYGVRFSSKAKPEDLWKTYFTSSRSVKKFRKENGEPDVIQIRKMFDCSKKAREWETKVITRMKLVESKRWLNQTDNTKKFYHEGPRGSFSEEHRRKLSEAAKKRKRSKEHIEALHASRRGKKLSASHREALSKANRGKILSEEHIKKLKESRLNDPLLHQKMSVAGRNSSKKYREDKERREKFKEAMRQWWAKRKNKNVSNLDIF